MLRITTMLFVDVLLITVILISTGEIGALFWGGYLWAIIGYSMRYGTWLLAISYVLSLIGFALVLGVNKWWLEHLYISSGLFLTLLLLPLYLHRLMGAIQRKAAQAKESGDIKSDFLAYISH